MTCRHCSRRRIARGYETLCWLCLQLGQIRVQYPADNERRRAKEKLRKLKGRKP